MPSLAKGGAEKTISDLVIGMSKIGIQSDLIIGESSVNVSRIPGILRPTVLHSRSSAELLWKFVSHLRSTKPDIVLATVRQATLIAVVARLILGRNFRLYLRETSFINPLNRKGLKTRLWKWAIRLAYQQADGVIAISHDLARELTREVGLRCGSVSVVPNGVDLEEIGREAEKTDGFDWLVPEKKFILSVGRLVWEKDHETLLRAFARLKKRDSLQLIILGKGPLEQRLKDLAWELQISQYVSFPGVLANPYPLMRTCELFVLPSRVEAFGLALLEALACGATCISTDCPGAPKEVLANSNGSIVKVGDHEGLAIEIEQMLAIAKDPQDAINRAKVYSVQLMVKRYVQEMSLTDD